MKVLQPLGKSSWQQLLKLEAHKPCDLVIQLLESAPERENGRMCVWLDVYLHAYYSNKQDVTTIDGGAANEITGHPGSGILSSS